jgi:hypothetical protein
MSDYEHFTKANDPASFHYELDDPYSHGKKNGVLHHSCLNYEAKLFNDKIKSEKKRKKQKMTQKELSAFPPLKDPYKLMRQYQ